MFPPYQISQHNLQLLPTIPNSNNQLADFANLSTPIHTTMPKKKHNKLIFRPVVHCACRIHEAKLAEVAAVASPLHGTKAGQPSTSRTRSRWFFERRWEVFSNVTWVLGIFFRGLWVPKSSKALRLWVSNWRYGSFLEFEVDHVKQRPRFQFARLENPAWAEGCDVTRM